MVEINFQLILCLIYFPCLSIVQPSSLFFSFVHFVVCIEKDYRYHMEISCYAMQIIALEAYYVSR